MSTKPGGTTWWVTLYNRLFFRDIFIDVFRDLTESRPRPAEQLHALAEAAAAVAMAEVTMEAVTIAAVIIYRILSKGAGMGYRKNIDVMNDQSANRNLIGCSPQQHSLRSPFRPLWFQVMDGQTLLFKMKMFYRRSQLHDWKHRSIEFGMWPPRILLSLWNWIHQPWVSQWLLWRGCLCDWLRSMYAIRQLGKWIQDENSGCVKPPVEIDVKVVF